MVYTTLTNITGTDQILVYVASNIPSFSFILLTTIFLIITFSTYYGSRKFYGSADFFSSAVVGSFITSLIAIMMTLTPGIITTTTLTLVIVVTSVLVVIFFLSGKDK